MPVSSYFEHQQYNQLAQDIVKSMSDEVIKQKGINAMWIHNPHKNVDDIYIEDRMPELKDAKEIAIYVKDYHNPFSDNPMFSKFGFLDKTHIKIQISVLEWNEIFGEKLRPTEGDIFYIPQWNDFGEDGLFKVQYLDNTSDSGWNTLGGLAFWTITAERWIYASEELSDVDNRRIEKKEEKYSSDVAVNQNFENEPLAQNRSIIDRFNDLDVDITTHTHRLFLEDKTFKPEEETEEKPRETITDDWIGIKRDKPVDILNRSRKRK